MHSSAVPTLPFKISTLIYVQNADGDLLLLERRKSPNAGLWSPIGGKLEMGLGESPYEAARRETAEEIGLTIADADLHLFAMVAEKNYEARTHWLMFLFHCKRPLAQLPPPIDEGNFAFVPLAEAESRPIPETDRLILWPLFRDHRHTFTAVRADCSPGQPIHAVLEETL
jgi:8-oxo-dGTP diphosphatase